MLYKHTFPFGITIEVDTHTNRAKLASNEIWLLRFSTTEIAAILDFMNHPDEFLKREARLSTLLPDELPGDKREVEVYTRVAGVPECAEQRKKETDALKALAGTRIYGRIMFPSGDAYSSGAQPRTFLRVDATGCLLFGED